MGVPRNLPRSLKRSQGLGSSSKGTCLGPEEATVSDLRVGLSPQLIFYWDRNVVTEDLVTGL